MRRGTLFDMARDTWESAAREAIARQLHWHSFDQAARAIRASGLHAYRDDAGRSHVRITCRDYYVPLLRSMTNASAWSGKGSGPLDAAFARLLVVEEGAISFHFEVVEQWGNRAA
jgi:hypothetical protein